MDPNQALEDLRKYIQRIVDAVDKGVTPDEGDALSLAAAANALDEWITQGGELPDQWVTSCIRCNYPWD